MMFEAGKTYRTANNNTAQVLNDHGSELRLPLRICVRGDVHWAGHDGHYDGGQLLPGAIEDEQKEDGMNFSDALLIVKSGQHIARKGWNGKGMYLELQTPDANSKMSLPYIYMKTADNHLVPWLAWQTDLLAEDWTVVSKSDTGVSYSGAVA